MLLACGGGDVGETRELRSAIERDVDDIEMRGPVDLGWGPGVTRAPTGIRQRRLGAGPSNSDAAALNGGPQAHLQGAFGAAFNWPIIPIHMVLLPDGRVMSYGSDLLGVQGAQMHYSIWDSFGNDDAGSMLNLTHTTGTDIFCNTQALLPKSGNVLLLGGTDRDATRRYGRSAAVDVFDTRNNTLTEKPSPMANRRWYGTVVTNAKGEQVVLGGQSVNGQPETPTKPKVPETYASTPEVFRADGGWRTLSTATDEEAYGLAAHSWWYPRAWQAPNGSIFILARSGKMFTLDPVGTGSVAAYAAVAPAASHRAGSVMFMPGKIMSVRNQAKAIVVDINGVEPVVTEISSPSVPREDQSTTLLADGKVWVSGGSVTHLSLADAHYHSEIWDPATDTWSIAASASKARLYHSTALLLPDATVITGGGGAPGPVTNLNAERYYPPYLFKQDGSGDLAARPVIEQAPGRQLRWGEIVPITLATGTAVSRVVLVRTGAMTHGFDNEQRFMELGFVKSATGVRVSMPADPNLAPPGFYLLFVFDAAGVPSVAKTLHLNVS